MKKKFATCCLYLFLVAISLGATAAEEDKQKKYYPSIKEILKQFVVKVSQPIEDDSEPIQTEFGPLLNRANNRLPAQKPEYFRVPKTEVLKKNS